MGKNGNICVAILCVYAAYMSYNLFGDDYVPEAKDEYWGSGLKPGEVEDTGIQIRPFSVHIGDQVLKDLKDRLKVEVQSNRVSGKGVSGSENGVTGHKVQKIAKFWLNDYDWKSREKLMNKFPHYKTKLGGLDIHFQRVTVKHNSSSDMKTRPLLLLHGWPGSFAQFQKLIPMLTNPQGSKYNFEIIIPSLPGFGFSEAPQRSGMTTVDIAHIMLRLMQRLGHEKFFVHGEDWGSFVATDMAIMYHMHVMGVHTTSCVNLHPRSSLRVLIASFLPSLFVYTDEVSKMNWLGQTVSVLKKGLDFNLGQGLQPDALGALFGNSPTGMAAYILDKFAYDLKGDSLDNYDLNDLLDNIMIYWATHSLSTSARLYADSFISSPTTAVTSYVPTGCLQMPNNVAYQPEYIMYDKYYQMTKYTKASHGGRFPATETPKVVADDLVKMVNHMEWTGLSLFEKKNFSREYAFMRTMNLQPVFT